MESRIVDHTVGSASIRFAIEFCQSRRNEVSPRRGFGFAPFIDAAERFRCARTISRRGNASAGHRGGGRTFSDFLREQFLISNSWTPPWSAGVQPRPWRTHLRSAQPEHQQPGNDGEACAHHDARPLNACVRSLTKRTAFRRLGPPHARR